MEGNLYQKKKNCYFLGKQKNIHKILNFGYFSYCHKPGLSYIFNKAQYEKCGWNVFDYTTSKPVGHTLNDFPNYRLNLIWQNPCSVI